MESQIKSYNGSGDVKAFLENVLLNTALKGYKGQKAAQNLEGRACWFKMGKMTKKSKRSC